MSATTQHDRKHHGYGTYKTLHAEWLGEVPEHWGVLRLKYCVDLVNEKVNGAECDLPYTGLENIESWTGRRLSTDAEMAADGQASVHRAGDVLFGKLRPYLAKAYAAESDGICTGELLVLRPKALLQPFLLNQLLNQPFISLVGSSTYGAKMPRASWEFICNLPVLVPPFDEQRAIVGFLDREMSLIDALIEKKRRQIELLQEKRAALISHAVTKGLDPNAPMKESGVAWFGAVPQQWTTVKLRRISLSRCDGPFGSGLKSEHYVDEGIRVVRLQNIRFARYDYTDRAFIDPVYYEKLGDHDVLPGDLLIAGLGDENNPVGRACVAPLGLGPAMVKADCFRFRIDQRVASPVFVALQLSTVAAALGGALATGTTRARMNLSETADRAVLLPQLDEQEAIAEFLDSKTTLIDTLIEKINLSIERLREYRTALISAAVTGMIDVNEEVA